MKHIQKFENFIGEGKKEVEQVEEMAIGDVRVQAILSTFDVADKKEKEKIAKIITGNDKSDRKKIIAELTEIGYEEIQELVDEIGIKVHENVNEALNQGQARNISHAILNKMVDLDVIKPKEKTEELLDMITGIILNAK